MPAAKHRKGVSVTVYLSPERLDLLGVSADSGNVKASAKIVLLDVIDGKLSVVDREFVKEAALLQGLSVSEWCRQTLLMAARKQVGLPVHATAVATGGGDGPRYDSSSPYANQDVPVEPWRPGVASQKPPPIQVHTGVHLEDGLPEDWGRPAVPKQRSSDG
jgi:hypothetical protein